ncbi:MAG: rhomboid family intramembrane serine protease [Steroidobacteraceae bacterium]|jgi:membrane associated rhomboid family serine protease|nr:rhomboid family intramembrane serine protease [Steroidobacteraceae bacterium]
MPFSLPPATQAIIIANGVMYLLELLFPGPALARLALWPLSTPFFEPWQLITYAFLHQPDLFTHLLFNMLALFIFGRVLEEVWGPRRFLVFYFASVLAAGVTQLIVTSMSGSVAATVGASGGVFGVLLAFALNFPRQRILLLFPPIPMPAWLFVTLYGVLELVLGVTNTQTGVAHFAHLGGMAGAAVVMGYWRATDRARIR